MSTHRDKIVWCVRSYISYIATLPWRRSCQNGSTHLYYIYNVTYIRMKTKQEQLYLKIIWYFGRIHFNRAFRVSAFSVWIIIMIILYIQICICCELPSSFCEYVWIHIHIYFVIIITIIIWIHIIPCSKMTIRMPKKVKQLKMGKMQNRSPFTRARSATSFVCNNREKQSCVYKLYTI